MNTTVPPSVESHRLRAIVKYDVVNNRPIYFIKEESDVEGSDVWEFTHRLGRGASGHVDKLKLEKPGRQTEFRAAKWIPKNGDTLSNTHIRELKMVFQFSDYAYSRAFVQALGWFEHDHYLIIIMEFLLNSLRDFMVPPSKFTDYLAIPEIMSYILKAVGSLHARGVAHRDLKPEVSCQQGEMARPFVLIK
ncbi:MAG: hypothetical protein Q9214_000508 [Letrouitia sp. 1 TL-2023]